MNAHWLKLARRPAPSGRVAHFACALSAQDCFAQRIKPEWFAVRGFAVPVRYARPGSPPTAGGERIRNDATTDAETKSHRPRDFRATITRHSRNDHKLSTTANFPLSFHARKLAVFFPRLRIFSIRVQVATAIQLSSIHRPSAEYPKLHQRFPHPQYKRCLTSSQKSPSLERVRHSLGIASLVCVHFVRCLPRGNHCPFIVRFLLLLGWRSWFRRKSVRTFVAALCCRASRACFLGTPAAVPGCILFLSHARQAFIHWPLSACGWSVWHTNGEGAKQFDEFRLSLNPNPNRNGAETVPTPEPPPTTLPEHFVHCGSICATCTRDGCP